MILILNDHSPEKLVKHLLSEVGLMKEIMENTIDSHFSFNSGRKIIAGYFVTLYECGIKVSESTNKFVYSEEEKVPKWKDYVKFFLDPIKTRFKEGLLTPQNNPSINNFGSFEQQFMDFKPFEQQEKEIAEKQEETKDKKLNIRDLMKISTQEFIQGKKNDIVVEKKEETGETHEEEEDHFNFNGFHGIDSSNTIEKHDLHQEKAEFMDNNFWSTNELIVDEVALEELMKDL